MRLFLDNEYHIYDDNDQPYGHTYNWQQAKRLKKAYKKLWPDREFEIREVALP